MASIETDRASIEDGLRVAQLLPSIVIGDSRTGNNRGDTKVRERPHQRLRPGEGGDRRAGAATRPIAGARARDRAARHHLPGRPLGGAEPGAGGPGGGGHPGRARRRRRRSARASTWPPTTGSARRTSAHHPRGAGRQRAPGRPDALPQRHAAAGEGGADRARGAASSPNALEKLGTIFGVYGEWGQPVHDVGNDVRILGLPIRRPDTAKHAFRMLCRHNKYVQEFGQVRDAGRDRAPRAGLGAGDRSDRVRDRPRGGGAPAAGVPPAARGRDRSRVLQAARSELGAARAGGVSSGRPGCRGPAKGAPVTDDRLLERLGARRGGPHPGLRPS